MLTLMLLEVLHRLFTVKNPAGRPREGLPPSLCNPNRRILFSFTNATQLNRIGITT
jgi:hypothetical protein